MAYDFQLTEEIARWAFEIQLGKSAKWFVAFCNPTAGPWKRIMAPAAGGGKAGEVYRFPRDDERPDLILVSDPFKIVVVLEAKDSLPKILVRDQMKKSCAVIKRTSQVLSALGTNPYWAGRARYSLIGGLLWGALRQTAGKIVKDCVLDYAQELKRISANVGNDFVVVEVVRSATNDTLECFGSLYRCDQEGCLQIESNVTKSMISAS